MPSGREHVRISKEFFGDMSLGESFQRFLDRSVKIAGGAHRGIDHTSERLAEVSCSHGSWGYAEFLVHLGLDYGIIKSEDFIKSKKSQR